MATSDVGSDKGPEPGDVAEAMMDCIQIEREGGFY